MKTLIFLTLVLLFISVPIRSNVVMLEANNPYNMEVRLELKCDYDRDLEMFKFHKFIKIKARRNTTIAVPNNLKRCQIWPKVILW